MGNRWGNNGNNDRLFWGAPKSLQMVTAAMKLTDTCTLEEKFDQPRQHIKKQRHYFANKCPSSQGYAFSSGHVWMRELDYKENWASKNWYFLLWCWRRLLKVPWTVRRSNQSILKISPECSLEGLMLKLKLHYAGHLMWRAYSFKKPWCWERLRAGGEGADRGWDGWMASLTQWTWVWVDSGSWWWTGRPGVLWFMESQRVGHNWTTELNWILAWNVPLISPSFLKGSLVLPVLFFPLFLCIVHLRTSYLSLLFAATLHSIGFIVPFLPCLALLFVP